VDWLTFLAALVKAVAWPAAVIVLAILLRLPIAELLSRVSRMRIKHGAWEIESELEAIHHIAETHLPPLPLSGESTRIISPATRMAIEAAKAATMMAPIAAVTMAWMSIERALIETARGNNVLRKDEPATQDPVYIARALVLKGKMDEVTYAIFAMLNQVRNTVVHSTEGLTVPAAIEFTHLTSRFVAKLLSL
jgi:hypothetical protein